MKIAAEMHFKRPLLRKRTILAQSGPPKRFFQGRGTFGRLRHLSSSYHANEITPNERYLDTMIRIVSKWTPVGVVYGISIGIPLKLGTHFLVAEEVDAGDEDALH